MMNRLKHQLIYWFPVYIYVIIIFYLSSLSNVFIYAPEILKPFFMDISHVVYHIIEYIILGFLLYRALINSTYKYSISLAVIIAILYGITDEIHQLFIPFRIFSLFDILSDSFGAIVVQSLVIIYNFIKINKFFRNNKKRYLN